MREADSTDAMDIPDELWEALAGKLIGRNAPEAKFDLGGIQGLAKFLARTFERYPPVVATAAVLDLWEQSDGGDPGEPLRAWFKRTRVGVAAAARSLDLDEVLALNGAAIWVVRLLFQSNAVFLGFLRENRSTIASDVVGSLVLVHESHGNYCDWLRNVGGIPDFNADVGLFWGAVESLLESAPWYPRYEMERYDDPEGARLIASAINGRYVNLRKGDLCLDCVAFILFKILNVRNAGVILHHDYDPTDNEVGAGLRGKTPGAAKAAYTRFIREHLKFIQIDEKKRAAGLESAKKRKPGSSTQV